MGKPVEWSTVGIASFEAIVQRIGSKWSQREVDVFIGKVDSTIAVIRAFPKAYRRCSTRGYREALIEPYNLLIYREFEDKVVIELIWDGRRHPRSKGAGLRGDKSRKPKR